MNRKAFLLVFLALCAAAPAVVASPRSDLVREILRRVPRWPGTEVEIPIAVYEEYVRELAKGPTPPQPPVVTWIERAAYSLRIDEKEATLTAAFDVVRLPGKGGTSAWLLPSDVAWHDAAVDGRKTELRRADDGWLHFDVPEPGRYHVTATATLQPKATGDVRQIGFGTPPAGWTSGAVDSDGAWDVRFSRSPLSIEGTAAGTHGTVGLAAGDRLAITWQPPQPPVHRAAQIATEAHVGWTLADGVHQVRAILNLRLWGGETSDLTVALPPGADRVRISGPDVREVQTTGQSARVFLRGAIRQRSRLRIEFEAPRPATGRMTLPAFGVAGASHRGGTLAIAGGAGGVLLEMDSPGLAAMALHDLPRETRGLLAAAPVYAYRVTGPWEARADLVSMSEFPVRETLIDSALYTVLYRPDGRLMTKVIYEVRNRARQYMTVELPTGAELVVARVAEVQKNLARGPGRAVYVPLEKSVLTTAGLVSFPVELVYVMRAEGLLRSGTFRLPLPRADLPVAYARCAMMLPDGMRVGEWQGVLRRTEAWSSETAELEFEYGRGHLAKAPDEPPEEAVPEGDEPEEPEPEDTKDDERDPKASLRLKSVDEDRRIERQQQMLQGKNLFRAGVDYYRTQDYEKAAELFSETIAAAPESLEANKARQYLGNVAIALGKEKDGDTTERGLRATAKAVQKGQQWGNIAIRERQKRLLAQADLAVRQGNQQQAEAAYQVAVNLVKQLEARGEEAHEQGAVVRKAKEYLAERGRVRKEEGKKVAALEHQIQALQEDITETGGQELQQVVNALVLGDVSTLGTISGREDGALRGPAPGQASSARPAPQVELGEALAEQQVTLGAGVRRGVGTGGSAGYAYTSSSFSADRIEHLKKQVEQLKSIQGQLTGAKADGSYRAGRSKTGDVAKATRAGRGRPAGDLSDMYGATWDAKAGAAREDFGRRVSEKARDLQTHARMATELARQGRLDEAGKLIDQLEKRVQVTAGAADVLARRGGVHRGEADGLGKMPSSVARPQPPVAATLPVPPRTVDDDGPVRVEPGHEGTAALTPPVATKPKPRFAHGTRPAPPPRREPPGTVRPGGTVMGAPEVAFVPEAPSVADRGSVARFSRDLGATEQALAGEVRRRRAAPAPAVPAETARRHVTRTFDTDTYTDIAVPRREATAEGETDELRDVREALEDVTRAREALQREARRQDKVKFNVRDLAEDADSGRELVDFVARNYGWAMTGGPAGEDVGGVVVRDEAAVSLEAIPRRADQRTISGGTVFFDVNGDDAVQVQFHDGGSLVVENRPEAVKGIRTVLERLRLNLGQRVGVASRNFFVDAGAAEAAGIRWKEGANGVRYAVVNDGQVRGVMDVEQRNSGAAVSGLLPPRDAYREAVVGTEALIANNGRVAISRAGDERNTLTYDGNALQVAHDDYLLVDNGGYLTAVKSGRMQHWTVEVEPVRFPGVPAVVMVPTVGYTVKFEKTLLDASDSVELVADYTWQGDE